MSPGKLVKTDSSGTCIRSVGHSVQSRDNRHIRQYFPGDSDVVGTEPYI